MPKKSIEWEKVTEVDRGKPYVDHRSRDGHWIIAEGLDEKARKAGRPYALLHLEDTKIGRPWTRVNAFSSLREAQRCAEELT